MNDIANEFLISVIIAAVPAPLDVTTDSITWNAFLERMNAHVLQTFAWGELKGQFGWRAERVVQTHGGEIRAAAQILYRSLAPALTIGYVPRGPVVATPTDLPAFLQALKQHTRSRGVFMLKLEPNRSKGEASEQTLQAAGFAASPETVQPPATIHIDLTPPLDLILARMKSKWRYNIRLSEKKGVTVRAGASADFDAFHHLMRITGERDHFAIHGAGYYRRAFELLEASDSARLFIAEFDDNGTPKPLGMIFVTAFANEAIYLYGASGNEERNRMPNHALHWAAMQWAKERGCTRYDLWGIPETVAQVGEDANLPSSLYQFKQGFGGEIVRYTGAWDLVYNQPLHRLYKLARRIRKSGLG